MRNHTVSVLSLSTSSSSSSSPSWEKTWVFFLDRVERDCNTWLCCWVTVLVRGCSSVLFVCFANTWEVLNCLVDRWWHRFQENWELLFLPDWVQIQRMFVFFFVVGSWSRPCLRTLTVSAPEFFCVVVIGCRARPFEMMDGHPSLVSHYSTNYQVLLLCRWLSRDSRHVSQKWFSFFVPRFAIHGKARF